MKISKISLNERKIENDYHINYSNIRKNKNGNYEFVEFEIDKTLADVPNVMLKGKRTVMVYVIEHGNIFYKGFVRQCK